jgi:molecular chaperone DnaK
MAEIAVGIDLGTSNTCVALMRGGEVRVLDNAFGERTSASVVHFREDGSVEVGNSAKAQVIHAPESTVSSAKRLIGRYYFSDEVKKAQSLCAYGIVEAPNHGVRIEVGNEDLSLPEISAMVLREMKQIAERHVDQPVTKAVITVPAYFNDNQRQATKDAGRIAGLEVLRILNEPTAAALAYGFGMGLNQRVAVYDLGGGTFDISVLEIGKDVFEVLATCGDTFLGGDDFDDRIIDLLSDDFIERHGVDPRENPYAFEKLKSAAEQAKRALSQEEETRIGIPDLLVDEAGTPLDLDRVLTRAEFAQLTQDLVMRTFKVCDEALQQSELTVRDLDGVILVGGPTRLPMIREAVTGYFQQAPRVDVDPDEVVAMGAAIHAASLVGEAHDSMLLDVTPLDLRIGVAGGLTEPVIERNTPVPIEQTRTFTTVQDHQEAVQIRVYQGDHRKAEHNALLGEFEFSGFQKGLRADVKIDVTFEIDADGIVNVTATDRATGEAASTRITLSSGLAEEQIERILDQDVAGRVVQTPQAPADSTSAVPPIELETPENPAVLDAPTEEVEEPFGDAGALFDDGCPDLSLGREEDGFEIDDLDTDGLDSIEDDELDALALEMDLDAGELELDAPLAEDPELEQDFESEGLCLDPPNDGEAPSLTLESDLEPQDILLDSPIDGADDDFFDDSGLDLSEPETER